DIRMIASVGFVILGSSRSSKRTSRGAYRTAPRMLSPPRASLHELDGHRRGTRDIESFDAAIDRSEDDDPGVGYRLTVLAVIDRHVRPGGPVRDLSDLVSVGTPAFLRDRPRKVPVLLPPEEVVHRERQRQQRGEVPAGLAFEQRRGEGRGSDLEANLHRAHHLL